VNADDAYEANRLAAVRRTELLDTAPEPEFDELVVTAAAVCGTPISVFSLVDENRQFMKATVGLDMRETTRDVSFCDHAIRVQGMMTVEDASLDPRFRNNPYVTGEHGIRFYAAVPLTSSDGYPLGALCVFDRVPRTLSAAQSTALMTLARQVNARIELRIQRRQLERALAELKQANRMLAELAATDPLTGLANRRILDERLRWEMAQLKRNHHPLAMLMFDFDNFKRRNDTYGHSEGDEVLRQFSAVLRHSVRESDLAARYGGEEFAVLLPETDEEEALHLAERILDAVRAEVWPHEPMTLSVGAAALADASVEGTELVKRADQALYAAKRAGKDRAAGYSSGAAEASARP
jgi:diguanylate cyclase (GGDEF)-like protein